MSAERHFEFGVWRVACRPEDGGRLCALGFGDFDLLTTEPAGFRPPAKDLGRYETRPVFGYDDCFPSVDSCRDPDTGLDVPDHGELCWLPWEVRASARALDCTVASRLFPISFRRTLEFEGSSLNWRFEVTNSGAREMRFLHIMHALMPLDRIAGLTLPACAEVAEETAAGFGPAATAGEASRRLLQTARGAFHMLLLRGVREGILRAQFREGRTLTVEFPARLFTTLGIWWNNGGYPAEEGCRRTECAFEPLPGRWSALDRSCAEGPVATVPAGGRLGWTIRWTMS